ncbi:hypothetical protein HMPREF1326_02039 [Akkermansia sp. KLE1605]|nr:hypothetical protein HMPREF1326_02039 [Akkermansia sp. KLE1605]
MTGPRDGIGEGPGRFQGYPVWTAPTRTQCASPGYSRIFTVSGER